MINVLLSAPYKACQRREGLQLNRRPAEINVGLVFAAVSDADKVPLADHIAYSLGWNLVGDDSFWSNVFQNLRRTQRPGTELWVSVFMSFSASSCDLGG